MSEIQQLKDQVDELTVALEQFGVFNMNATKKMGVFEKQQKKVTTALKRSPLNAIRLQLQGFGESMANVVKRGVLFANLNKEQQQDLKKNMTVMEKLAAATIAHGAAVKFGNKVLDKKNTLFRRIMVSAFSLVSIFLIVGFALVALSLAFEGANSPLLTFTEDLGPLHDAMQGLVFVITGEGDEGGLATSLDILAAAFVTAGIASLALGGTVGLIVGAITIAVGAARMFNNEFDNVYAAIGVGIGVFVTLIGTLMMVKKVFALMKAGSAIAIKGTAGAVVAGIGLVIAGIAGLVAFAMGAGEGIKGVLLGIISALLVFVGLFIAGVSLPIAAVVALGLFLVAIIIRYRDEILAGLSFAFNWVVTKLSQLTTGVVNGVKGFFSWLIGGFVALGKGIIKGLLSAIGFIGGLLSGFVDLVSGIAGSIIDFFIGIPGAIYDGIVGGFKIVFNAVAGIYNDFAEMMTFDIPDWVPVVGGKGFKLPQIPMLAEGGIVTGPTLAMIGDNPSGKEAVVPLEKAGEMGFGGGGGITVNINVGGVTDRTDKKQLAREIGDLIRAEMSRGGRSHGNRRSGV